MLLFWTSGTFGQLEDSFVDTPNMERDFAGSDQDSYAQTQLARAYQAEQVERAILSQLSDSESGKGVESQKKIFEDRD